MIRHVSIAQVSKYRLKTFSCGRHAFIVARVNPGAVLKGLLLTAFNSLYSLFLDMQCMSIPSCQETKSSHHAFVSL